MLCYVWREDVMLDDPRFERFKGQITTIIGKSGGGKSVLLSKVLVTLSNWIYGFSMVYNSSDVRM